MELDFYSFDETFKIILDGVKNGKSFIRFGDGEFRIICGHRTATPFQTLNDELKQKLIKISCSEINNLMLCFANFYNRKQWLNDYITKNMNINNKFLDARFTRCMGKVNGNLTD